MTADEFYPVRFPVVRTLEEAQVLLDLGYGVGIDYTMSEDTSKAVVENVRACAAKEGVRMTADEFYRLCRSLGACREGMEWIKGKSLAEFWQTCERGDWMLWLCDKMQGKEGWPTRQQVVLAACDCAELVLPVFEKEYPDDRRPRQAIETARAWTEGKATIDQVWAAYEAAAASYAVLSSAAVSAAVTAAAAAVTASGGVAANAASVPVSMRKQCAEVCRKRLQVLGGSDGD